MVFPRGHTSLISHLPHISHKLLALPYYVYIRAQPCLERPASLSIYFIIPPFNKWYIGDYCYVTSPDSYYFYVPSRKQRMKLFRNSYDRPTGWVVYISLLFVAFGEMVSSRQDSCVNEVITYQLLCAQYSLHKLRSITPSRNISTQEL